MRNRDSGFERRVIDQTTTWRSAEQSALCKALPVQFSLFGAAAAEPMLADVDGVLLAGGHWARLGGTARLSIVLSAMWRAAALTDAFAERGVAEQSAAVVPAEGGVAARTAFSAALAPHAARWMRGANEGPPPGFMLSPGGLRLWAIATGRRDEAGYLLATADSIGSLHSLAGAQLARMGLAAISLTQRPGPGWRITSAKRLRRLAELVGEPPPGGESEWPPL